MAIKQLWTEKHRPATLEGYVFHDDHQRKQIEKIVSSRELPHLLLSGVQGSGKTTIARILIRELKVDDVDLLEENASDKTGVDFIRDEIIPFCGGYPMGAFKVVHLEEFDYLSQNAQGMLRAVMEEYSNTCRFIATCNYENKVIPAIRSRFQQFRFKAPTEDDVIVRMIEILDAEKVEFDPDVLMLYVKQAYPDLRKIINNMQESSIDGKLVSPKQTAAGADYKFKLLDLLNDADIRGVRKLVSEQVPAEELEDVYRFLWQNLGLIKACKKDPKLYDKAVLVLDKALETSSVSALPHLTFEAACIRLMMVLGES